MIYNPRNPIDNMNAPHFTMREVARSNVADRWRIDNTPSPEVLERARTLAIYVLEPIRARYSTGFSPNSWYRGEELEKIIARKGYIGWAKRKGLDPNRDATWTAYFVRKQHPTGMAADIEVPGISNDELFDWAKSSLVYDQLIREFPKPGQAMSGWVHVSFNAEGNRGQAFIIG